MPIDITQAEQDVLANIRDDLQAGKCTTLRPDGVWGTAIIALANRVSPNVKWTDIGNISVAEFGPWTLSVGPSHAKSGVVWHWNAFHATDGDAESYDDADSRDAAKAAAVKCARGQ